MFDEPYVKQVAQALELEIAPEHLPGVLANLRRIAEVAAPALRVSPEVEDELAPVWRP